MKNHDKILIGAAVAGMLGANIQFSSSAHAEGMKLTRGMVACEGVNHCKGHGSCAGKNGCGGNDCKGQGKILMKKAECDAIMTEMKKLQEDSKNKGNP